MLDRHKMTNIQVVAVLRLWDATSDPICFREALRRLGWHEPNLLELGSFKEVMRRGNVILKFDGVELAGHTRAEWTLWCRARAAKRRYLARCYRFYRGLLIQEYVGPRCPDTDDCDSAKWIGRRLRILDWGMNHAHRVDGKPVFFDYDAKGPGWYVPKRGTPIDAPRAAR